MVKWKRNLVVLWIGQFFVMGGMTMIIPFLPLYIQELGIHNEHEIAIWAGVIFAANFVTSFIFQPIWGRLADRYGRKVMLIRSGLGMAIVMTLMGFAGTVWTLLILRLLNGVIAGFTPAAVALMSANTPKEKMGFAMGMLQSGVIAGTILGPVMGGLMAGWVGYRPIFYITGLLILTATGLVHFVVREKFNVEEAAQQPNVSVYQGFRQIKGIPQLPALFAVTFIIQFALLGAMPLMPLYVEELHVPIDHLALYAGLVISVTGFSNMVASPLLGRLGDKWGSEKILGISLVGAALALIPQAMVHNVWQLFAARFFLGIFLGGLIPSVHALIRKYTPDGMEGRAYSFNTSSLSLGNMAGPIAGGLLSGWISIRGVFVVGALLLLVNAIWVQRTLSQKKPFDQNVV